MKLWYLLLLGGFVFSLSMDAGGNQEKILNLVKGGKIQEVQQFFKKRKKNSRELLEAALQEAVQSRQTEVLKILWNGMGKSSYAIRFPVRNELLVFLKKLLAIAEKEHNKSSDVVKWINDTNYSYCFVNALFAPDIDFDSFEKDFLHGRSIDTVKAMFLMRVYHPEGFYSPAHCLMFKFKFFESLSKWAHSNDLGYEILSGVDQDGFGFLPFLIYYGRGNVLKERGVQVDKKWKTVTFLEYLVAQVSCACKKSIFASDHWGGLLPTNWLLLVRKELGLDDKQFGQLDSFLYKEQSAGKK
ncbi:MAG: hypothetical protein JW725_02900 [Candidatus Babeliaceae bacterium]|nr:hypothetical protein [Candidatus Babeliaceae bacterium]